MKCLERQKRRNYTTKKHVFSYFLIMIDFMLIFLDIFDKAQGFLPPK